MVPYIERKKITVAVKNEKCGGNKQNSVLVTRDNKTERMRTMKSFEEIMGVADIDLKGLVIEQQPDSLIVTAKKKIYVPEKKVVLLDEMSEQKVRFFEGVNKGGLIA